MPGFNAQDPHDEKETSSQKLSSDLTRRLWHTHKEGMLHTYTQINKCNFFLNQTLAPPSSSAGSIPSSGLKQGLLQAGLALSRSTAEIHQSCLSKPQKTCAAAFLHLLPCTSSGSSFPLLSQQIHCLVLKPEMALGAHSILPSTGGSKG